MSSDDHGESMDTDSSASPTDPSGSPTVNYQSPLLPPCRVCGEKASGFHYGANTCEACKGFFRRSLQRKSDYKCVGSGACQIQPGKRNACAACRYQKCLSVGMSKDAIKTGRYTHEKKAKDISEVKRLEKLRHMNDSGLEAEVTDISSPDWSPASSISISSPGTPTDNARELENIIQRITQVYLQQTPHTPDFFSKLPEKEKDFLEKRKLQHQVFGTMKPIPRDEYKKIYETTGIDVDGRREMITHMIPCIEKAIRRFIAFAKALPGFKDLPIDDQIALIKAGRFDSWVIESHMCFNLKLRLFTPLWACGGEVLHLDDMASCQDGYRVNWMKNFIVFLQKLQDLKFTPEETQIARAVAVLFTDRCDLKEPDRVTASQEVMIDCLKYLFEKNHPEEPHVFVKFILILTELRTLHEEHRTMEDTFYRDFMDMNVELPALMKELVLLS